MMKDGRFNYSEIVDKCEGCPWVEQASRGHYVECAVVLYPGKMWSYGKTCQYREIKREEDNS